MPLPNTRPYWHASAAAFGAADFVSALLFVIGECPSGFFQWFLLMFAVLGGFAGIVFGVLGWRQWFRTQRAERGIRQKRFSWSERYIEAQRMMDLADEYERISKLGVPSLVERMVVAGAYSHPDVKDDLERMRKRGVGIAPDVIRAVQGSVTSTKDARKKSDALRAAAVEVCPKYWRGSLLRLYDLRE